MEESGGTTKSVIKIDLRALWEIEGTANRIYMDTRAPYVNGILLEALHEYIVNHGGRPGFAVDTKLRNK